MDLGWPERRETGSSLSKNSANVPPVVIHFSGFEESAKCVNSLSGGGRLGRAGTGYQQEPAWPGLAWSRSHRRSPAPALDTAANSDSSRQTSETLFSFSVFFLFVSSFSVVSHSMYLVCSLFVWWLSPLSLYRCYCCFLSTTIAPVTFKIIRDIWLKWYKSDTETKQ